MKTGLREPIGNMNANANHYLVYFESLSELLRSVWMASQLFMHDYTVDWRMRNEYHCESVFMILYAVHARINEHFYRPQTKLRKGNVFTSVCQEFCAQSGQTPPPPRPDHSRQTPPSPHIKRLLQRMVRILLECILVTFAFALAQCKLALDGIGFNKVEATDVGVMQFQDTVTVS